jgi:hypothetical protein
MFHNIQGKNDPDSPDFWGFFLIFNFFESPILYDKFQLVANNRVNKPMIKHLKALEGWSVLSLA